MAANDTSAVNDPDTNFEQVDSIGAARCAEINTESINTAINMLPEATRERYNSIGQPLVASDADLAVCNAGPCWIWSRLEYDNDGESVTLSSPSLAEKNQNPLPCGEKGVDGKLLPCPAGMHYCKLLSPARALEWMFVDGLRLHGSLASRTSLNDKTDEDEDEQCCEYCNNSDEEMFYSIDNRFDQCGVT